MTFREIIKNREEQGNTDYYSSFLKMEKHAQKTWLPSMAVNKSILNSYPHLVNVEALADKLVPDKIKNSLTSLEIFVLLSSILLHDVKKVTENDIEHHSKTGCVHIAENWYKYYIPEKRMGHWISEIVCSHGWPVNSFNHQENVCSKKNECKIYENNNNPTECKVKYSFTSDHGTIHLDWIAAILRICDEVENHASRVADLEETPSDKRIWRGRVTAIDFDEVGECVKIKSNESLSVWENDKAGLRQAIGTLHSINEVLEKWGAPLLELQIRMRKAFLEISNPLPILIEGNDSKLLSDEDVEAHLQGCRYCNEPGLSQEVLTAVSEAILRLCNGVVGRNSFSWKSLSSACGVTNIELVKLATKRIQSFLENTIDTTVLPYLEELSNSRLVLNDTGWLLRIFNNNKKKKKVRDEEKHKEEEKNICNVLEADKNNRKYYVRTFVKYLDHLLCPELTEKATPTDDPWENNTPGNEVNGKSKSPIGYGFYLPYNPINKCWDVPVITVEGSSGDGKTTLATQIACNLMKKGWLCIFYSLEQTPGKLIQSIKGYNYFNDDNNHIDKSEDQIINFEEVGHQSWKFKKQGNIVFPSLTPVWGLENENHGTENFSRRYRDLQKSLEHLIEKTSQAKTPIIKPEVNPSGFRKIFCFIDSLNAFSSAPLTREQLIQLFALFRRLQIPLLSTIERQANWAHRNDVNHYNIARYLADIELSLESYSQKDDNYFRQTIEVKKTRFNRRILGRHQMKLKSPQRTRTGDYDPRVGVVIYPSIHYILSRSQENRDSERSADFFDERAGIFIDMKKQQTQDQAQQEQKIVINSAIVRELLPIGHSLGGISVEGINDNYFNSNSCFVVSGPHGGHKFALAVNLLLNHKPYILRNMDRPNSIPWQPKKVIISLAEESFIELDKVALNDGIRGWKNMLEHIPMPDKHKKKTKLSERYYGVIDGEKHIPIVSVLNFTMGQIMPEEMLYIINEYLESRPDIDSVLFDNSAYIRNRFPSLARETLFIPTLVDLIKNHGCYSVFIDVVEKEKTTDHNSQALLAAADCKLLVEHEEDGDKIFFRTNNVRGKMYGQEKMYVSALVDGKGTWLDINNNPFKHQKAVVTHINTSPLKRGRLLKDKSAA